ncbi:hypothetical protein BDD12DRAFT_877536 [Trichophaea hybrida]|nr:hypothetical protein BDD12DRAFT_877536 [Trichophaea hybrida]
MPPQRSAALQRTISPAKAASKPVKSERTHEENQERAYIAASRRSDRSLEARIESARRASEIHKRRTGRALRVTEADVVNEEMYEEEDDDVTHAYRNLGLLMGGNGIDRRCAAYYQHQMQMRNIVDRALQDRIARTGNGVHNNGYTPGQMFPPGYIASQQYPFYRQTPQMQSIYRQQPYHLPLGGHSHGRAMSMHIPQSSQAMRMAQSVGIIPQTQQVPSPITPITPESNGQPGHMRRMSAPSASLSTSGNVFAKGNSYHPQSQPTQLPSPESDGEDPYSSLFPLTNELPGESARFLAGQLPQSNFLNMTPYNAFDLFENTTYTTSKGFTTSLSPSQQNDPFEPKTEDGLATATGELKWQPSKQDSPFSNSSTLNTSLLIESTEEDALSSLFDDSTILPIPTSCDAYDGLSDGITVDPVDNETWLETFMDNEWLNASIA